MGGRGVGGEGEEWRQGEKWCEGVGQERELWEGGELEESEGRGKLWCTKLYISPTFSDRI